MRLIHFQIPIDNLTAHSYRCPTWCPMVVVDVDVGVAAVWVEDVHEWEEEGWDDRILDGVSLEDITADLIRDRCPLGVGVRDLDDLKGVDINRTCPGKELKTCGDIQTCHGQPSLICEALHACPLEVPLTVVAVDGLWIHGGSVNCWHRWRKPAVINPAAKLRMTTTMKKKRMSLRKL